MARLAPVPWVRPERRTTAARFPILGAWLVTTTAAGSATPRSRSAVASPRTHRRPGCPAPPGTWKPRASSRQSLSAVACPCRQAPPRRSAAVAAAAAEPAAAADPGPAAVPADVQTSICPDAQASWRQPERIGRPAAPRRARRDLRLAAGPARGPRRDRAIGRADASGRAGVPAARALLVTVLWRAAPPRDRPGAGDGAEAAAARRARRRHQPVREAGAR